MPYSETNIFKLKGQNLNIFFFIKYLFPIYLFLNSWFIHNTTTAPLFTLQFYFFYSIFNKISIFNMEFFLVLKH